MRLEQLQAGDADEVIDFLRVAFHADRDAPFLAPATIQWKYFTPRPDWSGSRSYVYRDGGGIVAHCCLVPIDLRLDGRLSKVITVADWAATATIRGIGRALLAELTALVDARLAFGGSVMGAEMLRRSKLSAPFSTWRRGIRHVRRPPLRPAASTHTVTAALKWVRDSTRLALVPYAGHGEWEATPVQEFDDTLPDVAGTCTRRDFVLPLRTPSLLNYLLACPAARVRGYLLTRQGRVRGHLLLFSIHGEVRVGDLQIDGATDHDWTDCFALAVRVARNDFPEAWKVVADAFAPVIEQALRGAGYRLGPPRECRAQDPGTRLSPSRPPALGMIDNDTAWL